MWGLTWAASRCRTRPRYASSVICWKSTSWAEMLEAVNLHLQSQGVRITTGTIVDATIIHAPSSTKNREQRRYRYKDRVDEGERARNRAKSRVRSKVEHVFGVMKLKFGFVKVRYRGLKKNANRLFATCALVNLFMARRKLLYSGA